MLKAILFPILKMASVLTGVIAVISVLFASIPVDPAAMAAGQRTSEATLAKMRQQMGVDLPVYKRVLHIMNGASPIGFADSNCIGFPILDTKFGLKAPDFGTSFQTKQAATVSLMPAFYNTLLLSILALGIAILVGIPLGVVSALKPNSALDSGITIGSAIFVSLPSYFTAILILYVFAWLLKDYTGLSLMGGIFNWKGELVLQNLILPTIALGLRPVALISQLTRNAYLEILPQDYMSAALMQGIPNRKRIWILAMKNALNPVITALTGWFSSLITGAYFIEVIFNYKGLGFLTVAAIENLDIPILLGSVLIASAAFVILNAVNDILIRIFDPKIQ